MEALLSLNHVGYSYHTVDGETPALHDVNFTIDKGEFVAIVGPSGCGKSTLLSLICGLIPPEEGQILLAASATVPSRQIGYMLQKDHLFEWRTIDRNVGLGLEIQHMDTPAHRARIHRMLQTYGLSAFVDHRPSALSGGMRQRAALIRTLALDPDLLLLDEPFSALDYQTRLEVSEDILSILRQEQKTAILVTHDLSEAISMADRVIVLSHRPGTVRQVIPICFSPEYDTPLKKRNSPEFSSYFHQIWKELTHNE